MDNLLPIGIGFIVAGLFLLLADFLWHYGEDIDCGDDEDDLETWCSYCRTVSAEGNLVHLLRKVWVECAFCDGLTLFVDAKGGAIK